MEYRPWHRQYDYNMPTTIRYPQIAAQDLLQIPANAHPNKPAIAFADTEITSVQLRKYVLRMANVLVALGVQKGDRIGIHLPNCPQFLISYYAVLSCGAIVVNLNPAEFSLAGTGIKPPASVHREARQKHRAEGP